MSLLPMFACAEGSATLLQIDDESVFTDDGTAFEPVAETHPVDFGPAGGVGRLRELMQWVGPRGTATIKIAPVADGEVLLSQQVASPVSIANGMSQRLEVPFSADGARFGAELMVTDMTGAVQFGEADLAYIPRRSRTGGHT